MRKLLRRIIELQTRRDIKAWPRDCELDVVDPVTGQRVGTVVVDTDGLTLYTMARAGRRWR